MNASGPQSMTREQLKLLDKNPDIDIIVSKSATLEPFSGNPEPNVIYYDNFSINAVGLKNFGIDYYFDIINSESFSKPILLSVAEQDSGKLLKIIDKWPETKFPVLMEYNASCPNHEGAQISDNAELLEEKMQILSNSEIPYGIKLAPFINRANLLKISESINKYVPNFIVCSNSLGNAFAGDNLSVEYGAIGGSRVNKLISLANVRQFSRLLSEATYIVGCGGIQNKKDVQEYKAAGAIGVQVGTAFFKDTTIFNQLH